MQNLFNNVNRLPEYPKEVVTSLRAGHSRVLCGTIFKQSSCYGRKTLCTSLDITSEQYSQPSTSRTTNSSTPVPSTSDTTSSNNDLENIKQGVIKKCNVRQNLSVEVHARQYSPGHQIGSAALRRMTYGPMFNERRVLLPAHFTNLSVIIHALLLLSLILHTLDCRLISLKTLFRLMLFYLSL